MQLVGHRRCFATNQCDIVRARYIVMAQASGLSLREPEQGFSKFKVYKNYLLFSCFFFTAFKAGGMVGRRYAINLDVINCAGRPNVRWTRFSKMIAANVSSRGYSCTSTDCSWRQPQHVATESRFTMRLLLAAAWVRLPRSHIARLQRAASCCRSGRV